MQIFTFLTILILGTACGGPVKKDVVNDEGDPKLVKTINDPRFGSVRCSLKDRQGNLWFGTTENGLYKYDGKSFKQFTVKDGLDCNNIYCLLEDKEGQFWIGTEKGLCLYTGKSFNIIRIPLPDNLPPNKNSFYQNHWVYSILQARNGQLWLATIDGVYISDGKTFTHFPMVEAANGFMTSNDKVERIFEDMEGNIWLGGRTNEGVFRYDGKTVTHLQLPVLIQGENGPRPKPHRWGWPQLQDKNGNLWFTSWGGAYRYDGKTITGFSFKDGITGTMIAAILEDKKGNIWFSGDGLYRYDGKSITPFTAKDGLANLGGWSILEDASGHIWMGTKENGLYIFDGKEFISYSTYKE